MKIKLKTEKRFFECVGEELELRELNYRAQCLMLDAAQDGKPSDCGPIAIIYGITEFADLTVDQVCDEFTASSVKELSDAVLAFSGLGEDEPKKLESVRTTNSATP